MPDATYLKLKEKLQRYLDMRRNLVARRRPLLEIAQVDKHIGLLKEILERFRNPPRD